MRSYAFISHSSADQNVAERLGERLGTEKVWVDFWNLDAGEMLPRKIAEAIHLSKWFILIASQQAMRSGWIRYELNIALVRRIEEEGCRIIVARIDDCKLYPELSPFLYVDCPGQPDEAVSKITDLVISEERLGAPPITERRRRIVNRFEEIAAIEQLAHEGVPFICLWGIYGIGKTTIVERACEEVFRVPLAHFPLTEAHGALRLALELSARAKVSLPDPSATDEELIESAALAVVRLGKGF